MQAKKARYSVGAIVFMVALALLPLLISADPAMAFGSYLTAFNNLYRPGGVGSSSGTNASCALCHATTAGGNDLNVYGEAFAAQAHVFSAIEGANSDGDPTGATNLAEITASTQPGWTPGPNNTLYDVTNAGAGAVTASNQNPPAITGSLDPAATNLPPVANAGANQAVNVGQTVQLNGSASTDPEGHLLTYNWTLPTRPTGSTAALTNPTTVNPTFTPDVAGTYAAQLIVNDGTQNSAPASVTITAAPAANLPPVANAGPAQAVAVGQLVTLDGSASTDPERQALTYSWSFTAVPAGSTAALAGATTVHPTFTPTVGGSYTVQLVVNDGTQNSAPATVTISAAAQNLPPVANAGSAQAVSVGQLVTLNGSGSSDPEGHALTYSWSFVSRPAGSAAVLANATTVNPTFTTDAAGNFVVQLIVNDGTQNSAPATVTIAATAQNLPPVANAGSAQTVAVGATVTLNGSGSSDPEGHALTYSWSFVSRPAGSAAVLTNPTTVNPTFVADVAGQYVVGLVVNDSVFNSPQSNVVITASATPPANRPPALTNPGNKTVNEGQLLSFTLTATDPDGNALTFASATLPTGATLTSNGVFSWTPATGQASATPYSVTVTVTDNGSPALSASQTFTITVTATPTTPPPTAATVSLAASPGGAQAVGTPITATATANGVTGPTYRFWLWNGSAWSVARDWGSASFTWTPTAAGSYQLGVWVKPSSAAGDVWAAYGALPVTIAPATSLPRQRDAND